MMSIIGFLYSMVGVVAIIGYTPQIISLWKSKTTSKDISIPTWLIWLATWFVSLAYGFLELHDLKFCIIAIINIIGHFLIIGLTLKNRRQHQNK